MLKEPSYQISKSSQTVFSVLKEPPYQISESGYGSFQLPIEIFFKNKEEPRKICFDYDLFLHLEGSPPVNHTRCEKLTFQGPNEEFRRKLIKSGGVSLPVQGLQCAHGVGYLGGGSLFIKGYLCWQVGVLPSMTASDSPVPQSATAQSTASGTETPESKAFSELFGMPIKPDSGKKDRPSVSAACWRWLFFKWDDTTISVLDQYRH